ncbi:MAG: CBS domain-containing protein [bacterium]
MGAQTEKLPQDSEKLRQFTRYLLEDLHALERMLSDGKIEADISRIGAEQELVIVGSDWRPSPRALEMLEELEPHGFTPELALFNLEFPVGPLHFEGKCLQELELALSEKLTIAREAAKHHGVHVGMFGILPSIRKADLSMENMTPRARYQKLNDTLIRQRGRKYDVHIRGTDELVTSHDNLMLEGANTSFQVHFQVPPEEFALRYNIAQVALGPVLAAAGNSALLGRYRLWHETRIALFQQSLDTRSAPIERQLEPRVSFGTRWVDESVLELFQEDIARFKVLFALESVENPAEALEAGRVPQLEALRLHTGTVYRWNRAVYGIIDDHPSLRIENRALPAGPTIIDEVANAAFWFGLMAGLKEEIGDVRPAMKFEDARDNFANAAMHGLEAQMTWLAGERKSARELILNDLLPLAYQGLRNWQIDEEDTYKYLGIIEERVESGQTGAVWQLRSFAEMTGHGTRWEKVHALVAASFARQATDQPVHTWKLADLSEAGGWQNNYVRVEQLMASELYTVHPDDPLELAANVMKWRSVRHVLVEDDQHRLVGLITYQHLLKYFIQGGSGDETPKAVRDVMSIDPIVVAPDISSLDAITLMRQQDVSCLPVVKHGRLVGMITKDDFMNMAGSLLRDRLEPPA